MTHWLEVLVLFFGALIAGLVVIYLKPLKKNSLRLLLTFGGAFLIGLCFLHLLPEIFQGSLAQPGWFVLAGFLVQILLELGSQGIEHGHDHAHTHSSGMSFTLVIALAAHALIEGMPFGDHNHHHHALLVGVLLHKIPVAMVLASMVISWGMSKGRAIVVVLVFALMAPLGMLVYQWIGKVLPQYGEFLLVASLSVLVGMLLHISTTILFESSEGHKMGVKKLVAVLTGIGLAAVASLG